MANWADHRRLDFRLISVGMRFLGRLRYEIWLDLLFLDLKCTFRLTRCFASTANHCWFDLSLFVHLKIVESEALALSS